MAEESDRDWNHYSFDGCRFWDEQLRYFRLGRDGRGYTIDAFGFEFELQGKGLQHMRWAWETFPDAREMMDDEPPAAWISADAVVINERETAHIREASKCDIHDWPTDGLSDRLIAAMRDRPDGVDACVPCLERARDEAATEPTP